MELILNTFGVSLNRDNEAFVITSKGGRQRIPVDDIKSIQISRGATYFRPYSLNSYGRERYGRSTIRFAMLLIPV